MANNLEIIQGGHYSPVYLRGVMYNLEHTTDAAGNDRYMLWDQNGDKLEGGVFLDRNRKVAECRYGDRGMVMTTSYTPLQHKRPEEIAMWIYKTKRGIYESAAR